MSDSGATGSAADTCPSCGSGAVKWRTENDAYTHFVGSKHIELAVTVRVGACSACGSEFLGPESEDLFHDAVCRHLGRMTPAEVRGVRGKHGLSRQDFCRLTGIGDASLARWERGELIQSAAHDQFLYLLMFADNLARLRERGPAGLAQRAGRANPRRRERNDVEAVRADGGP